MRAFRKFLLSEGMSEVKASHCLSWVEHYAKFCDDRSYDYWDEEILSLYLDILTKNFDSWKVGQASDAIGKYKFWRRGDREAKHELMVQKLSKQLQSDKRSLKTRQCYINWLRRFLIFTKKGSGWTKDDLKSFIKDLLVTQNSSCASQNQAVAALRYFYIHVLNFDLGNFTQVLRARVKKRLPIFFSHEDIVSIYECVDGVHFLMIKLMYGAGLRPGECYGLRIRDIDFKNECMLNSISKCNTSVSH